MIIVMQRIRSNHICTVGELFCEGFSCSTMEPPRHAHGRLRAGRIPANQYTVALSNDAACPVASKYAVRFGANFHQGMLTVTAGEKTFYLRMGNYPKDTQGDILLGLTTQDNSISESQTAYEDLYPMVEAALVIGDEVKLDVRDENDDFPA